MTIPFAAVVALAATSLLLSECVTAQQPATTAPACDRTAITWTLPGDFDRALARAVQEQRMIVIKGISFGVDVAGARCATKGVW